MKIPKQAYTIESKELAVRLIKNGQSVSQVCKELGLSDETVRNWVRATAKGKLNGAGDRVVTPEEMEPSRLRAENLRLKRKNEIWVFSESRLQIARSVTGDLDQRAATRKTGSMKLTLS